MSTNPMEAAHRAAAAPDVRKKAIATFRKTMAAKKAALNMHSPAARRKASITRRRNFLAKKRAAALTRPQGGTLTTIDVGSLPLKPPKRDNRLTRRTFSPEQRARLVGKVSLGLTRGMFLKDACARAGIHEAQYRKWRAMNGA